MSNAIKFSPEKKSIEIACDYNYKFLVLSVKDHGPGFSELDLKDMYKKFQKLSARPTGGESSTGLGLAIVKLLVEKLDGNIEVIYMHVTLFLSFGQNSGCHDNGSTQIKACLLQIWIS